MARNNGEGEEQQFGKASLGGYAENDGVTLRTLKSVFLAREELQHKVISHKIFLENFNLLASILEFFKVQRLKKKVENVMSVT